MMEFALRIASVLSDLTRKKYKNDFSDIESVKIFWHDLSYLIFSHANCRLLGRKHGALSLSYFAALGIVPNGLSEFERENADLMGDSVRAIVDEIVAKGYKLSSLRECLLGIEPYITKNSVSVKQGKSIRNLSGAYYTPYGLAAEIVGKVFAENNSLLFADGKKELRIADLSCGCGEFFSAAQQILKRDHGIEYAASARFFWGTDVDPIALQIAVCSLLENADRSDWSTIAAHFTLGNPLIAADRESSLEEKNKLFALNRIYAPEMGICYSGTERLPRFDVIFGNPPWEKIRFEERKFFSSYDSKIADISKKDERDVAISALRETWGELYRWETLLTKDYAQLCSKKYRHPLIGQAATGELNTYALFTELCYRLLDGEGICSLITKSTLATAPAHAKLWKWLLDRKAVSSVCFFENKNKIFRIDSRERFAVITLSARQNDRFSFACGLKTVEEFARCGCVALSRDDLLSMNPLTSMIPNFSHPEELGALLRIHRSYPPFYSVYPDCRFGRLIHLTAHASEIFTAPSADRVPIYEGKFLEQYDARFSTFAGVPYDKRYTAKASAARSCETDGRKPFPESRYFVNKNFWNNFTKQYSRPFSLCWRSLTSPTNARTMIAMILPTCPTCQSIQMLQTESDVDLLMLLGLFNSLPFDYLVRMKMPGVDLTQTVVKQIPVPPKDSYERIVPLNGNTAAIKIHILSLVYRLLEEEDMLQDLLIKIEPLVYRTEDLSVQRARKLLDRAFAFAYRLDETSFTEIARSFPQYGTV